MNKNNLLSIGDMSKLTGASIKSLRYYERINLLKPAYVDPASKYRYYSLAQTYWVEIIMFCVEMDIPLKELGKFTDAQDTMDFRSFIQEGKQIAEKKIKSLQKGLQFLKEIEAQMDLTEEYPLGEIYVRELPRQFLCIRPCGTSMQHINPLEVASSFLDLPYGEEDFIGHFQYGFLCEYKGPSVLYYAFGETPKGMEKESDLVLPAGKYVCIKTQESQLEQAPEIFAAYLEGRTHFYVVDAIEDMSSGKRRIDRPVHELRVITAV